MKAELTFIGVISTPYKTLSECPNNIDATTGPTCQLKLHEAYREGLLGLEPGQQILVLYWLGDSDRVVENLQRGRGGSLKGTFALRSPIRPNPIGAAVLPIEEIGAGTLTVKGLDCLDGTQLLDIKPAIYRETI